MVRIEHCFWSKRSEGDVRDGCGSTWAQYPGGPADYLYFNQGGSSSDALEWVKIHGATDLKCVPWVPTSPAWRPTCDRVGRTTKITDFTWLGDTMYQKLWIDAIGPIVCYFEVWDDFWVWDFGSGKPYRKSPGANYVGNHAVLIVGYDEIQQAWIIRNSWGPWWGQKGYGLIGYGEVNIDMWSKMGLNNVSPDPWSRRRHHNGNLYQSSNGAIRKNFELLRGGSEISQFWRDGSTYTWNKISKALPIEPRSLPSKGNPVLISSSYNRNWDTVFWDSWNNLQHWSYDQNTSLWSSMGTLGWGQVAGYPGFIQSSVNTPGNMEVVVLQNDGRLHHWHRGLEKDDYGGTGQYWTEIWGSSGLLVFASDVLMSGPSFIQSNVGSTGNLYTLAVKKSGQLELWYNNLDDWTADWIPGELFGVGYGATPPCMIQGSPSWGDETTVGNFEVCIASGGQIHHWWRNNSDLNQTNPPQPGKPGPWARSAVFGQDILHVWGLVQTSYSFNLELVAERTDHKLQHFYRNNGTGEWFPSSIVDP